MLFGYIIIICVWLHNEFVCSCYICWSAPAPRWLEPSQINVNYTNSFIFVDDRRAICCNFEDEYSKYNYAVWWEYISGSTIFEIWNNCLHIWPNSTHLQSGVYMCVFQDREVVRKKYVVLSKLNIFDSTHD